MSDQTWGMTIFVLLVLAGLIAYFIVSTIRRLIWKILRWIWS